MRHSLTHSNGLSAYAGSAANVTKMSIPPMLRLSCVTLFLTVLFTVAAL